MKNNFDFCHDKNGKIIVINYKIKTKYIYQKHITQYYKKKNQKNIYFKSNY